MLNFPLLPGDKYDGRCAEIYITEKQFLVYHCSVCEEIYATFNELLSHITKDHYENTKEYSEVETRSVETIIRKQDENNEKNQLQAEESRQFEENLAITNKVTKTLVEVDQELNVTNKTKDSPETEDVAGPLDSIKSSPQRKKPRFVTGMLKNYVIGRSKLNPLTRYQVNPNEERKYVCGICGFAFKEKYNLRSHLLRHSNQKNFSCSTCPKKFFTKVELRLHEYRHKGERPYLCNHCGMGFVSSGSLIQHIKKHHSLHRPFKCEHCDKTFSNFYQLRDHQPVHSEERIFHCPECTLTFKCKKTLNNHMKLHENRRKYRCENCDLGFSTETVLNTHQRKKHNFKDESTYELVIDKQHVVEDSNNEEDCDSDDYVKDDSVTQWTIEEGELALEQNFDEYELVQTLTDLECIKNV
ncbi:zinc finger protein 845-like [Calliphora vicina]|uniref:zinc finger protein 845-like n=1 Tax=Calliphora vicina TaxID=7373 RepID=UPI00325B5985